MHFNLLASFFIKCSPRCLNVILGSRVWSWGSFSTDALPAPQGFYLDACCVMEKLLTTSPPFVIEVLHSFCSVDKEESKTMFRLSTWAEWLITIISLSCCYGSESYKWESGKYIRILCWPVWRRSGASRGQRRSDWELSGMETLYSILIKYIWYGNSTT